MILGDHSCTGTGIVNMSSGLLFVTNAAGNATLDIRTGTLNFSGGFLQVNKIILTNLCAHFARTGGTLIYTSIVLNPNDDSDGDGFTNQQEATAGSNMCAAQKGGWGTFSEKDIMELLDISLEKGKELRSLLQ